MARKKAPTKKAKQNAPKQKGSRKAGKRARKAEKKALPKEIKMPVLLPPIEKDVVEEAPKPKDEFFDEEAMKEFSVLDEEEGQEEDAGDVGDSEPAWDEEEY